MAFNPGLSCIQTKRRTLFLAAFMLLASTVSLWAGDSDQAIEYISPVKVAEWIVAKLLRG